MKKLKKERKKFNQDYLKPLIGCLVLFVLLVIFMIIFGYNPKDEEVKEKKTNYYLNIDDNAVDVNSSCDTNFYKSVIEDINKIDLNLKVVTVEGETVVDEENSYGDDIVYYTKEYYGYEVHLNNIPENIKVVIKDNKTENVYNLNKNESTFTSLYTSDKVIYTVNVYGDVDNCKDVLLRQFNFTTPAYNIYSETAICENSNDKNCDVISYEDTDISNVVQKEMEENVKAEEKEKNNILTIVIASLLIVIIIAAVVFIYLKRRRKRMVM